MSTGFCVADNYSISDRSCMLSGSDLLAMVKYEEECLRANYGEWAMETSLSRFLWRFCHVRPHSSLGGRSPEEACPPSTHTQGW